MTKKELKEKLNALGPVSDEQRNKIVCSLIGHSKIVTGFFGYVYCARCGEQIGDALGGCFDGSNVVIVGHNCPTCKENYKKLTWKDKIFCPNPFKNESEENSNGSKKSEVNS